MANVKDIVRKLTRIIFTHEDIEEKKETLHAYDADLIKSTDKHTFEQLVKFYMNGKQADFPESFTHKDEYFEKGQEVYETIGVENYIKEIKIMNKFDYAGEAEINTEDNKVEIIIYILSNKLGIKSDGDAHAFTIQQCEEFADVLAHELFHAQNNIDIIEHVGIEEYDSIRKPKEKWTKIAWMAFDEYCACRKNAKQFESVESVDKIERILNYIQSSSENNPYLMVSTKELLYSIATVSAFADESKEEEALLAELNKAKNIFQEVRCLFNNSYLDKPLNGERYCDMGRKLKRICNSYTRI